MVEELMGAYGTRLVIAIVGVGLGLLLLVAVLWFLRGRNGPSPFVRGGKNRQPRLQVLDAAAVDTRRRLVLVRRDDVEHLIMIGGPTDIVIESGISTADAARAPVVERPAIAERPASPAPAAIARPVPAVETRREEKAEAPRAIENAAKPGEAISMAASPTSTAVPVRPQAEPALRRPVEPATPSIPVPTVDQANSALDAARRRVLQQEGQPANPSPAPAGQPEKGKELGSDFERILEEEMANNLAARETAVLDAANRQNPPRSLAVPPARPAKPEPSLQSEVARIFGEMSASRDK